MPRHAPQEDVALASELRCLLYPDTADTARFPRNWGREVSERFWWTWLKSRFHSCGKLSIGKSGFARSLMTDLRACGRSGPSSAGRPTPPGNGVAS